MGWYDLFLEHSLGLPCEHRHDCPLENSLTGDHLCALVPGTPVFCKFTLGFAEHTGICLGDKIAHLNGDGKVLCSTPAEFLARLDGSNLATSIYYAAAAESHPLASPEIAARAIMQLGSRPGYHPLVANCHDFTIACITGKDAVLNWRLCDIESAISSVFHTLDWHWRCWNGWHQQIPI
ncbi:MAG: hypothetical protein II943_07095 [Victivallales bacterium]|nr:hypothetical protein [Victivallales bacterium]